MGEERKQTAWAYMNDLSKGFGGEIILIKISDAETKKGFAVIAQLDNGSIICRIDNPRKLEFALVFLHGDPKEKAATYGDQLTLLRGRDIELTIEMAPKDDTP